MRWRLWGILGVLLVSSAWAQNVPRVTITTPTSGSTYTTSTTPLFVGGTARDNRGVTQIHWTNDRGGEGLATGTTPWSVSVPLQLGVNQLTITAFDAEGHSGRDTLAVTLTAPPPPPGPITVEWTYGGTSGESFHMERCIAPLPCTMAFIASIALGARQWTDTAVSPDHDYCYRMAVVTQGVLGAYSNSLCSQ